jgi:Zn-dependent protease with chaperone function
MKSEMQNSAVYNGRRLRVGLAKLLVGLALVWLGSAPASAMITSATIPSNSQSRPYQLPPQEAARAHTLGTIRTTLHFSEEIWALAVLLLLLVTGFASSMAQRISNRRKDPWSQAAVFSALLLTILFLAAELPPAVAGNAVSLHYGISVENWGPWLIDEAKTLVVSVMLETPLLMLISALMRWPWSRRFYWAWMALIMIPVLIVGTVLLPAVIEPIFHTFTPLSASHPALVEQLEKVVARTGTSIPPERMFLMKASDKSNGLNAYVTGLGPSKRIVVWDTTADRMPADQILFTFAHESGHYVLNHIPKGLAVGSIGLFALFAATAWSANRLLQSRGRAWRITSLASLPGLAVLLLSFNLLLTLTEPIQNFASRYIEHEADVYGQEAIHGIVPDPQKTAVAAFNTLGAAYLDDPDPNPFIEFWTYDHPSIQTRATFAEHYDPWVPGQKPRFFSR